MAATPSNAPIRPTPRPTAKVLRACIIVASFIASSEASRAAESSPLPTLTTVREIQQLSPAEAERGYPVKLKGTVIYHAPGVSYRFLQDDTGGTYFSNPNTDPLDLSPLEPGLIIEIEGITRAGGFAPYVGRNANRPLVWRELGRGPLPTPRRVSVGDLADPRFHSEYIELSGVVRHVEERRFPDSTSRAVSIRVGSNTATVTAQYFDPRGVTLLPEHFLGARVTFRGVYGTTFNDQRQMVGFRLFFDPHHGLEVETPGPADPLDSLPITPVSALMQYQSTARGSPMVRIAGTVTGGIAGQGFYLESQERGVWIEVADPSLQPKPGERVAVAGFPSLGALNPILKDAVFRVESRATLAPPPLITAAQAMSGRFDARRVVMEATVLDVLAAEGANTALLRDGSTAFFAEWLSADAPPRLHALAPGTVVRVTGVCLNKALLGTSDPTPRDPRMSLVAPDRIHFRLLVASVDDLVVVRGPPWWTPTRIWTALGVTALLALAFFGWILSLRRRVAAQTEIIRAHATREAVHEDRTRIARELHDTLEQELTGIAVQLDAVSDRLPGDHGAAGALGTARALLRHTRTEARRSVWDLRAALLEEGDLAHALRETARQLEGGPELRVRCIGDVRRLPGRIETNLLRIGTESMTNAVKHASARTVDVTLTFGDDVTLEVRDDGRGFDASRSTSLQAGHFGWLGIRERAERIGAVLTVESRPGAGTHVRVRVPATRLSAERETAATP